MNHPYHPVIHPAVHSDVQPVIHHRSSYLSVPHQSMRRCIHLAIHAAHQSSVIDYTNRPFYVRQAIHPSRPSIHSLFNLAIHLPVNLHAIRTSCQSSFNLDSHPCTHPCIQLSFHQSIHHLYSHPYNHSSIQPIFLFKIKIAIFRSSCSCSGPASFV